jgi:hypothetical protein
VALIEAGMEVQNLGVVLKRFSPGHRGEVEHLREIVVEMVDLSV